jgi:hypothetical protein
MVKGVVGFGLPTLCLALFALTGGLAEAMALLLAPSLVTNIVQAVRGGMLAQLARRLWPFLASAAVFVFAGAALAAEAGESLLRLLLGLSIATYAAAGLAGFRPGIAAGTERLAGPAAGAVNGVLTGLTGSFVIPGVIYLQALDLPRDALVQAMGLLFSLSTLALGLALAMRGDLPADLGGVSLAGVVPALLGMALGQTVRRRLSEALFRRLFLAALSVLGLWIAATAV